MYSDANTFWLCFSCSTYEMIMVSYIFFFFYTVNVLIQQMFAGFVVKEVKVQSDFPLEEYLKNVAEER